MKKSEEPLDPIRITTGTIIENRYFNAGEVLPYERIEDLPESLKPLVATGAEPPAFSPAERDFYHHPGPEQPGFIFQGAGSGQWVQRQAAQAAAGLQEQAWLEAEAAAANELPEGAKEALEAEHDHRLDKARAQASYNAKVIDGIYESATQAAEPLALFVRRGGEMGRVERSKLKAGEPVFAKFDGGDWQVVGYVDATGQAPPPPLVP